MKTKLNDIIGKRRGTFSFEISWDWGYVNTDTLIVEYNFEVTQSTECNRYSTSFDNDSDVDTFIDFAKENPCFNKAIISVVQDLFHQYQIQKTKGKLHDI